jgi:hypothetical protein
MKRTLVFYSFLSFTILPIAAILGVTCIIALPTAFGSPAALLDVFILASFVLYTFTSFYFFAKGIQGGKTFKVSFKDFIKVNGYVALISSALTILATVLFYSVPAFKSLVINNLMQMQPGPASGGMDAGHLTALIAKGLLGSAGYSALFIVHFFITIKVLRRYGYLFVNNVE